MADHNNLSLRITATRFAWETYFQSCLFHPRRYPPMPDAAHYIEGIKQYFIHDNTTIGMFHLKKSAKGSYDNGKQASK
ncbi:hypothetical protein Bca52824_073280 [Brassica carinata]|uniref:Uncharacterized protein n=1 Tax=Brassica carinata TaxID=52824 RepID=A0A8X7Q9K7_BRACI|nr:hypothetical protein Bca52824_073280 [Brassica carinata]